MNKEILISNNWTEKEIDSLTLDKNNILDKYYTVADLERISAQQILKGIDTFTEIQNCKITEQKD